MYRTILKVAGRNAFLRRSRVILLVLMIGLSMGVMVALEGLYDGMSQHMIDKTKRSDSGEISLYAKKYRLERDIAYIITDAEKKVERLKAQQQVRYALYRLQVDGLSQTARKSDPSTLIGIDLKEEQCFGAFGDFLQRGTLEFGKNGAFIGSELAKKLKVRVGSKVIFTAQDSELEIQSISLRIKAVIRTGNMVLDNAGIFLPRDRAASFLSLGPKSATQIAVRSNADDASILKCEIEKQFPDLEVYTFTELYPQL
jgi:ABC-type lipoprotein release transport system permease subunit